MHGRMLFGQWGGYCRPHWISTNAEIAAKWKARAAGPTGGIDSGWASHDPLSIENPCHMHNPILIYYPGILKIC